MKWVPKLTKKHRKANRDWFRNTLEMMRPAIEAKTPDDPFLWGTTCSEDTVKECGFAGIADEAGFILGPVEEIAIFGKTLFYPINSK